jgi:hypothetical protein
MIGVAQHENPKRSLPKHSPYQNHDSEEQKRFTLIH